MRYSAPAKIAARLHRGSVSFICLTLGVASSRVLYTTKSTGDTMWTSTEWLRYFETNSRQLLVIPWERGAELSADEAAAIARSVAEFQRGESGEGRRLIRYARSYAEASGDSDYLAAIRLFILEEQRHARDLARFLQINNLPLARASFADGVFRRLRHVVGTLEISIAVLITAELMAQVYYDALRAATR